jgi:hypothetical protein
MWKKLSPIATKSVIKVLGPVYSFLRTQGVFLNATDPTQTKMSQNANWHRGSGAVDFGRNGHSERSDELPNLFDQPAADSGRHRHVQASFDDRDVRWTDHGRRGTADIPRSTDRYDDSRFDHYWSHLAVELATGHVNSDDREQSPGGQYSGFRTVRPLGGPGSGPRAAASRCERRLCSNGEYRHHGRECECGADVCCRRLRGCQCLCYVPQWWPGCEHGGFVVADGACLHVYQRD